MYKHQEGIRLRKLHKGDLYALLKLKEESWWGTHNTSIINIEDQGRWYDTIGHNELYMIAEAENDSKVGSVGIACYTDIDWFGRTLNISGSIFKEQRNLERIVKPAFAAGLDFAFEILNMQRVQAEVLETNIAAQQLEIGYLGFKVEGRRRKAVYKAGQYYDSLMLGLLREEWQGCERVRAYQGGCNLNFDHAKAAMYIQKSNQALGVVPEAK